MNEPPKRELTGVLGDMSDNPKPRRLPHDSQTSETTSHGPQLAFDKRVQRNAVANGLDAGLAVEGAKQEARMREIRKKGGNDAKP